jgi:thioesterase domain-containing protein
MACQLTLNDREVAFLGLLDTGRVRSETSEEEDPDEAHHVSMIYDEASLEILARLLRAALDAR